MNEWMNTRSLYMNTTPLHNFKFSSKHVYRTCLTLYATKKWPLTLQMINHENILILLSEDTVHRMEKNRYEELKHSPGIELTRLHHKSLHQPWTALPALLELSSPNSEMLSPSLVAKSISHLSDLLHPKQHHTNKTVKYCTYTLPITAGKQTWHYS